MVTGQMTARQYIRLYFREIVARCQCEHCRNNWPVIRRVDSKEYTHSFYNGVIFKHTLCRANKWRQRPMNDPEVLGG